MLRIGLYICVQVSSRPTCKYRI